MAGSNPLHGMDVLDGQGCLLHVRNVDPWEGKRYPCETGASPTCQERFLRTPAEGLLEERALSISQHFSVRPGCQADLLKLGTDLDSKNLASLA